MTYTNVPTIISGDTITEDWTIAVETAIEELQAGTLDEVAAYTPQIKGSTANPNLGSTGSATGRYVIAGKLLVVEAAFVFNGTGIATGSGQATITLPDVVTPSSLSSHVPAGMVSIVDASAGQSREFRAVLSGGEVNVRPINTAGFGGLGAISWSGQITFAALDIVAMRCAFYTL